MAAEEHISYEPTEQFASWRYDGYTVYQVGGDVGGEAYLVRTDDGATALFDTGFAYCAAQTLQNIFAATGGQPVDWIVLTHSHYDHCAAVGYLQEHMPTTKVAASAHAQHVFSRPNAFKTMNKLNAERADNKGLSTFERVGEGIVVDKVLGEGDTLRIGELAFCTLEAVGHTKCCLAFWCESKGLFISCETSGVVCTGMPTRIDYPPNVTYMVDLPPLVSYRSSLAHIQRVRQLPIKVFVASHFGPIAGDEVAAMWDSLDFWVAYTENMIMSMHKQGATDEEIIATYKRDIYWDCLSPYQPESAFDINISYVVPTIIRDVEEGL